MTLKKFELMLKKINPRLRVRQRGYGDVAAVFGGTHYLVRLTKGELQMNGYKEESFDPKTGKSMGSRITKRGRKTVLNLLRNWRWINVRERSALLWGTSPQ